jgi:hypothetical protein
MFSERDTVVELPFAADSCPWVEKLRTVLPLTVGIRDGAVREGGCEGGETRLIGTTAVHVQAVLAHSLLRTSVDCFHQGCWQAVVLPALTGTGGA